MNETTLQAIREHAEREYPRECCGLVIVEQGRERYVACRNVASTPSEHVALPAEDFAAAEDRGEVLAVVHSHPDAPATPSDADRASCEASGLPWHILSWPMGDLRTIEPSGWQAPLVGRQFSHGVLDCWTLIRDWYARELNVTLPDFERADNWWGDGSSDLYTEHLSACGGEVVWERGHAAHPGTVLQRGDVVLMQIRSSNGVPNHGAVYLGDGLILHHCHGKLSTRDVYGGYWQECTRRIVRHRPADPK